MKQYSFPNHTVTILMTTRLQKSLWPVRGKKPYAKYGAKHGLCFNNICCLVSGSVSGIQIEALLKRAWCIWQCRELPLESSGLTGTMLLRWGSFEGGGIGVVTDCNIKLYLLSRKYSYLAYAFTCACITHSLAFWDKLHKYLQLMLPYKRQTLQMCFFFIIFHTG